MYRCQIFSFLSTLSARSTLRFPFGKDIGSDFSTSIRFSFCEEGCRKYRTIAESGIAGRRLSAIFGWPQGESKSVIGNPFPDKLILLFSDNHFELGSKFYYHREVTISYSACDEDLTKVLENFISNENGETCCIKEMYGIYIEKLCKLKKFKDALSLLRCLHDKQKHPELHTYNTLLAAAGEANSFLIFSGIFQNLLLSKIPPDPTTYLNVAKAIRSLSESKVLLEFIKLVSKITAHSDPTVVNMIIFATAKSGEIDKSLMMFEELKNYECKVDIVTFNTVLAILGKAGNVDKMLLEYSSMKKLGYSPNIVTYDTLISCLRRLGRIDLCKVFAKEMLERGFELDLESYTALIDGLGRAGHVDDAFILFAEMKKFHCPSIYVYRAMIANLRKFGKVEAAMDLLEEMKSNTSKLIGPEEFRKKRRDSVRGRKRRF